MVKLEKLKGRNVHLLVLVFFKKLIFCDNNWIRTLTIWANLICLSCRKEAQCRTSFLTKDHKGTEATVYSFFQCEPFT